jgi:hypothetical protein
MVDVGQTYLVGRAEAGTTTTVDALWQVVGDTLGLTLGDPTLPMPFLLRDISKRDDSGLVLAALVADHDAFADLDPHPPSRERHVEALHRHFGEG